MGNEELKIPVGKYKGQPIDILSKDQQYMEWLISQKWFRDKFSDHYTFIINNFSEPSDTPEHNEMQAKFLKDDYRDKFIKTISRMTKFDDFKVDNLIFEPTYGGDVLINCNYSNGEKRCNFIVEVKPSIGDDFPSVLRAASRIMKNVNYEHDVKIKDGKVDEIPYTSLVIVLTRRYSGEGVHLELVKDMFMSQKIPLVQESEFLL